MKKKIFRIFQINKPLLAVLSLLLSFLMIVGSTYAWLTYSDEKINRVKKNDKELSARIDETFSEALQWAPGTTTEKEVRVVNDGQMPVFVRLSLHEFFASFDVDVTDQHGTGNGNGNLKVTKTPSATLLDFRNLQTWAVGNTLKVKDDQYVTAKQVVLNETANHAKAYQYGGNRVDPLSYLDLNFEATIYTANNPAPAGEKGYWFYEKGYFYYSEILKVDEKTKNLLTSVKLSESTPNRYKGALYQLIPVMDAHDITKLVLDDWAIQTGPVYEMYREKVVK